jgi:ER membrane protein complex subunit 6
MIDPMAGLDAAAPAAGDAADEKDVIDFMALRFNLQRIDRIRSVMGIASGCVAGILGLTGLQGFGKHRHKFAANGCSLSLSQFDVFLLTKSLYIHATCTACFMVLHLFVLASIWVFKMNLNLYSYTRQSLFAYATTNLQQNALSFTLFWTLFYGLVYLY